MGLIVAVMIEVLVAVAFTAYTVILTVVFGYYSNFNFSLYMSNVGWYVAAVSFLAGFCWEFRRLSSAVKSMPSI